MVAIKLLKPIIWFGQPWHPQSLYMFLLVLNLKCYLLETVIKKTERDAYNVILEHDKSFCMLNLKAFVAIYWQMRKNKARPRNINSIPTGGDALKIKVWSVISLTFEKII